jgi:formate C-acetyltransferase
VFVVCLGGLLCSFLDTYFEEDLRKGRITEQQVQELVDQFVMKMRIVRWVHVLIY